MRIMSFGWTSDKLLAGKKTVTRRAWKGEWVKAGDLVQAYDKGPHRGGRKLGILRIKMIWAEVFDPGAIPLHEAKREGFDDVASLLKVLADGGVKPGDLLYRIEFEAVGELK